MCLEIKVSGLKCILLAGRGLAWGAAGSREPGRGLLPPCWWSFSSNLPAQRGRAVCGPTARDGATEGEQVPVTFLLLGAGTVEGTSLRREGREGQAQGGQPGTEPGRRPGTPRLLPRRSRLRCPRSCELPSRYQRALGRPRVSAAEEGVLGLGGPERPQDGRCRAQARPRCAPHPARALQRRSRAAVWLRPPPLPPIPLKRRLRLAGDPCRAPRGWRKAELRLKTKGPGAQASTRCVSHPPPPARRRPEPVKGVLHRGAGWRALTDPRNRTPPSGRTHGRLLQTYTVCTALPHSVQPSSPKESLGGWFFPCGLIAKGS